MSVSCMAIVCLLAAPPAPDSPSWPARVSELRLLLAQKRFGELERAIVASQERFERSQTSEDEPWATMQAFLENDGPTETGLSEWVDLKPRSYAALAARGLYYEGTGWSVRGSKVIRDTTSGQLRSMSSMHALAERDCERALAIRPNLIACHAALINIAKATGDEDGQRRRYEAARAATPESVLIATARLESLTPRWGGSYPKMQDLLHAIAKETLGQTPRGRALSGYVKADQAWVASTHNDPRSAVRLYTEAISLGGGSAAYYAGRGMSSYRLDRKADALKDFDRALELSPWGWPYSEAKLPGVLAGRAWIRFSNGRLGGAKADVRGALILDPSEPFALDVGERIRATRKDP